MLKAVLASVRLPQVPNMSLTLFALFLCDVTQTIAVIPFHEFGRVRQTHVDRVWHAGPGEYLQDVDHSLVGVLLKLRCVNLEGSERANFALQHNK